MSSAASTHDSFLYDTKELSAEYFKHFLCRDWKLYYTTPEYNERLYLGYKGFSKMQALEPFTGLKCLNFECNAVKEIEGLDEC